MSVKLIVLDSGVYARIFLAEEGRDDLLDLLQHIGENAIRVCCPDIFLYEVLSIAAQNGFPLSQALAMMRAFERAGLTIAPLTGPQLNLAMRMAEDGNNKAGFPSVYDSAYLALTISMGGVFVTADRKHMAKTGNMEP